MVYLVGAGPGDPGLLTLRGKACLAEADVVIYDYLVNPALLAYVRPEAARIEVGKHGVGRTMTQVEIDALLIALGREEKVVVRLKGGDPFVFGRGGEEALSLQRAGIRWEVVPGVTAGVAAPAYAGIPLTHRDMAATVVFATGHEQWNKGYSAVEWAALGDEQATAVFYMGVRRLRENIDQLIAAGRSLSTPAALVEWGTLPRQRVVRGTLETLPALVESAAIVPPALLVVGQVVGLGDRLQWFEQRPLFGKRVVVCRAAEKAAEAIERLYRLGAEAIALPTIRTEWVAWEHDLDAPFDLIVFTSQNGVRGFFERVWARGKDSRVLGRAAIAVVGDETDRALAPFGLRADVRPLAAGGADAEALVAALAARAKTVSLEGKRVLWPRGNRGRNVLSAGLRKLGAQVDELVVYETVMVKPEEVASTVEDLAKRPPDAVLFASPSQVTGFLALTGASGAALLRSGSVKVGAIGDVTAAALAAQGIAVHVQPAADATSMPGLIAALANAYGAFAGAAVGAVGTAEADVSKKS